MFRIKTLDRNDVPLHGHARNTMAAPRQKTEKTRRSGRLWIVPKLNGTVVKAEGLRQDMKSIAPAEA
jgi:hypothetical protein